VSIIKRIAAIFFVLAIVVIILLWYVGFFGSYGVMEKLVGPYIFVYENVNEKIENSQEVQNRVFNTLRSDGFHPRKHFGIYIFGKAKKQDSIKAGCLIETEDSIKLNNYENKYKILRFEKQFALTAEFPYQNRYSTISGMIRVYPSIKKYAKIKSFVLLPIIEIYDLPQKNIIYIMPIQSSRFNPVDALTQ
jgi:hypothetical protein